MTAVPRAPLSGDPAAQDLDAQVTKSAVPLGRLGVEGFWIPTRRDMVMQLPSGSGAAVLAAFTAKATATVALPEAEREAALWSILKDLVAERWRLDCERLWLALAPHKEKADFIPDGLWESGGKASSDWFRETWEAQAKRDLETQAKDST